MKHQKYSHKIISSLFLLILSLVTTTANPRRTLLQDNSEDLNSKQIAETQDPSDIHHQMDEVDDPTNEWVSDTIAVVLAVVVCIGFLAIVVTVICCCCCLPSYCLGSRSRSRGQEYQRPQAATSPRAEYPRQVMVPQGQPPSAPSDQQSGFYPPPAQQMPMQSFPPELPPPYPGPPSGSLQPNQDPYNYMYKEDCKSSK